MVFAKTYVKGTSLALLLMIMLTGIYSSVVMYNIGFPDGESYGRKHSDVSHPMEHGIWRHYFAEKMESEPIVWETTEELGITIIPSVPDHYNVYILDSEKALPWISGNGPMPKATEYQGEFYRISFQWLTPGLPRPNWLIPAGALLGVGWILTMALFLKWRKRE